MLQAAAKDFTFTTAAGVLNLSRQPTSLLLLIDAEERAHLWVICR